jgi:hypothetical protein
MNLHDLKSSPGSRAWLRMAALFKVIGIADCLAMACSKTPFLYTAIIPGLVPLLTVSIVIVPLLKEQKK